MVLTPKLGKGLGRKPDRPDTRDLRVPRVAHLGIGVPLPSHIDVFAGLSLPVYDQGELGSCTANAGVLYRRFLAQRFRRYSAADDDLSRLFLYYQERVLDGDPASDDGAQMRDVFRVLTSIGVCLEEDDPYIPADFNSAGSNNTPKELTAAAPYKIGAYHRVLDVGSAKQCLASGYAIALGFVVYKSFEEISENGIMPLPKPGEEIVGGHAVVIHGYDDARHDGCFTVRNSWGPDWGARGDFFMPYAFLQDQELSQFDMWMGHLGRPWAPQKAESR
jgi:C1A family cysteine protease